MKERFLTIFNTNKIKIPQEIKEKLNLKDGDLVEIEIERIYGFMLTNSISLKSSQH